EFRDTNRARAGRVLSLSGAVAAISGTLLAGALLALAGPLATHSLAAQHLAGLLRMSAPLILLGAINGAQTGGLGGFEAFKGVARINLVVGLASFPLTLGGVWLGGLSGVVWAMVAAVGLNCVMNHLALRAEAHRAGVPLPGLLGARAE